MRSVTVCLPLLLALSCDRAHETAGSTAVADQAPAEEPFFIAGGFSRGRGPDGNTVIYKAGDGLLVVDTGRHPGHSQEILNYAAAQRMPVATIVNTYWHLDHSTGNADIKEAYPEAKLYTTHAVERALDGFLANGAKQGEEMLTNPNLSEKDRAEIERGLRTIRERVGLIPDVAVEGPIAIPVNGRALELEVTDHAVTESDVWIWDPATKTMVAGYRDKTGAVIRVSSSAGTVKLGARHHLAILPDLVEMGWPPGTLVYTSAIIPVWLSSGWSPTPRPGASCRS